MQNSAKLGGSLSILVACAFCLQFITVSQAAIVNVANTTFNGPMGALSGGHAFVDNAGDFIDDPPGTIFFGGFENFTTKSAVQTAFATNFSALAADFDSIGSVGVESDVVGGFNGLHDSSTADLNPTAVVGRNVAIWLTTSGTIDDTDAQHFIYFTSNLFTADPVGPSQNTYQVFVLPSGSGGNGEVFIGNEGLFSVNYNGGDGPQAAFSTVAVPEPRSMSFIVGGVLLALFFIRRRFAERVSCQAQSQKAA